MSAGSVGWYLLPFAVGNFLGPLVLGRWFDTWVSNLVVPVGTPGLSLPGTSLPQLLGGGR